MTIEEMFKWVLVPCKLLKKHRHNCSTVQVTDAFGDSHNLVVLDKNLYFDNSFTLMTINEDPDYTSWIMVTPDSLGVIDQQFDLIFKWVNCRSWCYSIDNTATFFDYQAQTFLDIEDFQV
jgi:hypothetical protein